MYAVITEPLDGWVGWREMSIIENQKNRKLLLSDIYAQLDESASCSFVSIKFFIMKHI